MTRIAHCFVAAAVALSACRRVEEPPGQLRLAASASAATPAPSLPPLPTRLEVSELLTLPSSPYQAALFVDGEVIELLAGTAAYRLIPGKPPLRTELDLGFAATVTRQAYVYWSKGAIWSAERAGSGSAAPKLLVRVAEQPQRLVANAAGTELAWLEHFAGSRYAIAKRDGNVAKRLYTSSGSIDALVLSEDVAFFVERPSSAGWRVGRLALDTGAATFTAESTGRWPAMLGAARELFYYAGSRREVVSLSLDLQREHVLAKDFVCSPLVAASQVYCANLDGIFELTASGAPRQLVAGSRRVVASLAADERRLAFVSDVGQHGQDRLSVSVVALDAGR